MTYCVRRGGAGVWCRAAAIGVILAGAALTPATVLAGQQPNMPQINMDHGGSMSGRVRNDSGAAIAEAVVNAVNAANGAQFTATTDAQGAYSFGALPEGKYDVSIVSAGQTTFRRLGVEVAADRTTTFDITMTPASAAEAAEFERQQLLGRIATLEQRISDLESSTVLSEPETRVRRVEVFVDPQGGEHDEPVPGAKRSVTYQRERVYRRQTISEKIEEALQEAEKRSVSVGVDAAMATQFAGHTRGDADPAAGSAYALASADLFFTAGIAQYTIFFADIVGLSGSPPDAEIPAVTLLNGYTARLVRQNEINLREAWLRAELFGQRLALSAGRLDLTNYFDQNAFANDETVQFISDALVNNQMLGLSSNGTGVATEFDAKNGLRLKFGFQQSNNDATNLSDSMYTLSEVGYTFTPFALPEGTYRLWYRTDNTSGLIRTGVGVSADQKLTPVFGVFGRYGSQETDIERDRFYSAGVSFQNGLVFNPRDTWGVGFSHMDLSTGYKENLTEGYYNFRLTDRLRLSFHLSHVYDQPEGDTNRFGYLLPGVRFQAAF
jgi:hypothetical protein